MKLAEFKEKLAKDLQDKIINLSWKGDIRRAELEIHPTDIEEVGEYLLDKMKCRLIIATASQLKRDFTIYYHFSADRNGLILNVKVTLPFKYPVISSLANITSSANWIEREMHELYGIAFSNHPNMEKLISDGNWDEGVYPFRKDLDVKT